METYTQFLQWLINHPKLGFVLTIFVLGLLALVMAYLLMAHSRLHRHIKRLNEDKRRLMEEKDLIRHAATSISEQTKIGLAPASPARTEKT